MNQTISVRTVQRRDASRILAIRNANDVRRHFRNTGTVSDIDHARWFTEQLKPEHRKRFFVATIDHHVVGYVRYDLKNGSYDISIAVLGAFRKSGVGRALLLASLPKVERENVPIKAAVKKDNSASLKFFEKHGFQFLYEDHAYRYFLWVHQKGPLVIATRYVWDPIAFSKFRKTCGRNIVLLRKKEQLSWERLAILKPLYVFFPHWSWIIPSSVWQNFRCVVFHMTDLPYGRGGSPLQNLVLRHVKRTKISALSVTDVVDGGAVYLKRPLALSGNARHIYRRAFRTILTMMRDISTYHPVPNPQRGDPVVFRRRTPAESAIPTLRSLSDFYDFIRMLDATGYPHAFLRYGDYRLEFSDARLHHKRLDARVMITRVHDEETHHPGGGRTSRR